MNILWAYAADKKIVFGLREMSESGHQEIQKLSLRWQFSSAGAGNACDWWATKVLMTNKFILIALVMTPMHT